MPKVVIVDDNRELCAVFARTLQYFGSSTAEAHNGEEALDYLACEEVDLILLDLNMPIMGGADVLWLLAQEPRVTSAPVIVMSSELPLSPEEAMPGARAYFSKPVNSDALLSLVLQHALDATS